MCGKILSEYIKYNFKNIEPLELPEEDICDILFTSVEK
jgi:hypothetical protein